MPPLPRLTLIVATTPTLGIGAHGTLPWPPLKADLRFFARVTKRPPPSRFPARDGGSGVAAGANGQQQTEGNGRPRKVMNAVVMGRKTWDSLPEKVRPLGGRINVVVSRSAGSSGKDSGAGRGKSDVGGGGIVEGRGGQDGGGGEAASPESQTTPSPASNSSPPLLHASSLPQALELLTSLFPPPLSDPSQSDEPRSRTHDQSTDAEALSLGRVFIIGGAQIYALALEARTAHGEPLVDRILWTRVKGEWDCDVHFPRGILPMSGGEGGGKAEAGRPGMGWVVRTREEMEDWVGEEGVGGVKKEGEVEFEVVMVERNGGA